MKAILFSSTDNACGKSLLAWSAIRALGEMGRSFDIIKLGGIQTAADEAELELLNSAGLKPIDLNISEVTSENARRELARLCPKSGLVVIIGSNRVFSDPAPDAISEAKLAEVFDAHVFLALRYTSRADMLYTTLALKSYLGEKLAGVLLNRVPNDEIEDVTELAAHELEPKNIPITAIIPEDRILKSATIGELAEIVDGVFIVGANRETRLVEKHTLGTSVYKGKLSIFKRLWQRLALLGGTEKELADPDFESRLVGIIAAGRVPPKAASQAAQSENVSVIYTKLDSFTATDRLERAVFHPSHKSKFRIDRFDKLLSERVDIKQVLLRVLE